MNWKIKINGTFFITLIFFFVGLFLYTFLYNSGEDYSDLIEADNGILELSRSDFQYNIPLSGEWTYYEGQFITESSQAEGTYETVTIPHTFAGTGYGTYHLKLEGLTKGSCYSLYLYDQPSAFELYIGSRLVANSGRVGENSVTEEVAWRPQTARFVAEDSSVDIYMQISNQYLYAGGFLREIKMGTPANIQNEMKRNVSNQMILFGGVMMIGLYNMSLFLLNPGERSGGYFALFNFIVALRLVLIGERIVNVWFDALNWEVLFKLQFVTGAAMLGLLVLFMYSLFKQEHIKWVVLSFLTTIILFTTAIFVVPMSVLRMLDFGFLGMAILFFTYLLLILIKCIKKNIHGSIFSFIGISFILGSVMLDAVLPPGTIVIPIGIFIFLIFQSLVIGEKYMYIMEQNKMLHHAAVRDSMTNLYKKDHFGKLVSEVIEGRESLMPHSMMFIDIDNFKLVNDTYGHDLGDEMIVATSERILRSLRYSDIACRFGGDEFVVWLHNTKASEAEEIAERVLENMLETIKIEGHEIHVSVSIGISIYPDHGTTFEQLIAKCDEHMYIAKSKGKNQHSIGTGV
jgi:diguanylate cyclase (GGDEF)-like protein